VFSNIRTRLWYQNFVMPLQKSIFSRPDLASRGTMHLNVIWQQCMQCIKFAMWLLTALLSIQSGNADVLQYYLLLAWLMWYGINCSVPDEICCRPQQFCLNHVIYPWNSIAHCWLQRCMLNHSDTLSSKRLSASTKCIVVCVNAYIFAQFVCLVSERLQQQKLI